MKKKNLIKKIGFAILALGAVPSLALAEDPSIWDVPAGVSSAFESAGTLALALAALAIACVVVVKGAIIAIAMIKRFFKA